MREQYKGGGDERGFGRRALVLAALPIVPPLSLLSFGLLGEVRRWPRSWRWLLAAFVGTQLLAALLSPAPLWSLPLALLRCGLVLALLTTGFVLGRAGALRPVLLGYGVVAVTALVATLLVHSDAALSTRLIHPYYSTVSLGLAGTLGLLLAVTWRGGPWPWRLCGGGLSLGLFLWSGSRGPLLALAAGLLAVLAVSLRQQWRAVGLALLGGAAAVFALQMAVPGGVFERFMENTLNGRGIFWADALNAAREQPWGGSGPYQLGPAFSTQYQAGSCNLWLKYTFLGVDFCSPTLLRLQGAWLIAHNTAFHLLGETGVIGLTGWLALMGALAVAAWRSRDPLVNAVTWGMVAMGLVDNPNLLPNVGAGELYWMLSGVGVALITRPDAPPARSLAPAAPLLAAVLLGYFTLPLWLERVRPEPGLRLPVLRAITLPGRLSPGEPVTVFLDAGLPAATFHLRAVACPAQGEGGCRNLTQRLLKGPGTGWTALSFRAPPPGRYLLRLQLSDDRARLRIERPLAELNRVIRVE